MEMSALSPSYVGVFAYLMLTRERCHLGPWPSRVDGGDLSFRFNHHAFVEQE